MVFSVFFYKFVYQNMYYFYRINFLFKNLYYLEQFQETLHLAK